MFKLDLAKLFSSQVKANNYLVLTFFEGEVLAGIYGQEVGAKSLLTIRNKWLSFDGDFEKLSVGIDELLLNFEKKSGIHLEKTIFFFSGEFASSDSSDLDADFFAKIKDFAQAMELSVDGFLFLDELFATQFAYKYQENIFIELLFEKVRISLFFGEKKQTTFKVNYEDDFLDTLEKSRNFLLDDNYEISRLKNFVIFGQELALDQLKKEKYRNKLEHFVHGFGGIGEVISDKMLEELIYFGLRRLIFGENRDFEGKIQESSAAGVDLPLQEIALSNPEMIISSMQTNENNDDTNLSNESEYNGYRVDPISPPEIKQNTADVAPPSINHTKPMPTKNFLSDLQGLKFYFSVNDYIVSILIFILCLILLSYFYPKQIITLYYQGQHKLLQVDLNIDQGLTELEYKNEVEVQQVATGRKQIGEKSKGQIQISSLDKQARTLKSGTKLRAAEKIFLLENDVTLASASANLTQEGNLLTIASKAQAKITASDIGSEYNLPKGSKLSLESGDSLISATLQEASSGGSSEEVVFISKGDLLDSTGKVIEQVQNDIRQKMQQKGKMVYMKIKIDNDSLPTVGTQAKNLEYKAKVSAGVVFVDEEFLKKKYNLSHVYYQLISINSGDQIKASVQLDVIDSISINELDNKLVSTYSAKKLRDNIKNLNPKPYGYSIKKIRTLGVLDLIASANKNNQQIQTEVR